MRKLVHLVICTLLFLCITGIAQATTIEIGNASFEDQIINSSNNGNTSAGYWNYSVQDWDLSTSTYKAGTYNPSTIIYNFIPDGDQVAYTWGPSISQTLSTDLAANTLYSLSTFVGWRNDQNSAPNFLIELLGDGGRLASIDTASLTKGNWTEVSLTYLSPNVVSPGQSLGIRLSGSANAPVDFDMISLNAVPEPTTMMLLGFGLLGLAGVSRRKE